MRQAIELTAFAGAEGSLVSLRFSCGKKQTTFELQIGKALAWSELQDTTCTTRRLMITYAYGCLQQGKWLQLCLRRIVRLGKRVKLALLPAW